MTHEHPTEASPRSARRLGPLALALALALAGALGCQRVEEITRYTVPKERPVASSAEGGHSHPSATSSAPTSGPQRMLAAMLLEGERVWFFKAVGQPSALEKAAPGFRAFLTSLELVEGREGPTWELPEGWTRKPGSGMRFATIEIPTASGPLELTVTPLKFSGEFPDYGLANVNRWRDQLGLTPTTLDTLFGKDDRSGEIEKVQAKSGQPLLLVDLKGEGVIAPMGGGGGGGPTLANPPVSTARASRESNGGGADGGLRYKAPPSWAPGKRDGMRKAAFEIRDGHAAAEMTVISLPAGSGDLLANVNRWRDQVGLEPLVESSLAGQLTRETVGGASAHVLELTGPPGKGKRESILGAICARGNLVWFFKMKGDTAVVERERDAFRAFLGSVEFEGQDAPDHGR